MDDTELKETMEFWKRIYESSKEYIINQKVFAKNVELRLWQESCV